MRGIFLPLAHAGRTSPVSGRPHLIRLDQRAELSPRHQAFHTRKRLSLARRPVVFLESFCRRQRHLLHRRNPCDQSSLSDAMTKKSFTLFATYSVFP